MKVLIYLHHPAHFHLFKNAIYELQDLGNEIFIVATKKDVLTNLLDSHGLSYYNILPKGRSGNKISIAYSLLKQDVKLFRHVKIIKPDLLVGTSTEICHVGRITGVPSLLFNEDDFHVIKYVYYIAYPFAKHIVCPNCCNSGKWSGKAINYKGYHELAYLHPRYFKPNRDIIKKYYPDFKKYTLVRFSALDAHHDANVRGLTGAVAESLINILKKYGEVIISSERQLEPEYEHLRMKCEPEDIHHLIAFSSLFVGDSQTMAAEAGVLGVPFIRFNDFVGKIGYLEELERKYKLGFGISTDKSDRLLSLSESLLQKNDVDKIWKEKRDIMLSQQIDVTSFFVWLINNYPESVNNYFDY